MTAPHLSAADFRVLGCLLADAHRNGRLTDDDHNRTVIILAAAAQRQRTAYFGGPVEVAR